MAGNKVNAELIQTLKTNLLDSHARVTLDRALKGLPADLRGVVPEGMPYSIWQIVEHMRLALWDMVAFSSGPGHTSPDWPSGYWPTNPIPPSANAWSTCVHKIREETETFIRLLETPEVDLFKPFSYGQGQSLFREALQIIDHQSYHTGEIVVLRRMLGAWN